MGKNRTIISFQSFFADYLETQPFKVQKKILQTLRFIEEIPVIPANYFKQIVEVKGLFEIRVSLGRGKYRIFCCFDKGNLIVLLCCFRKKTQKTPQAEITRAQKLMKEYYENDDTITT